MVNFLLYYIYMRAAIEQMAEVLGNPGGEEMHNITRERVLEAIGENFFAEPFTEALLAEALAIHPLGHKDDTGPALDEEGLPEMDLPVTLRPMLETLVEEGILEKKQHGYRLTDEGRQKFE